MVFVWAMCSRVSKVATCNTFVRVVAAGGDKFAVTIILLVTYAMVHCLSGAAGSKSGSWGPIVEP